MALIFPMSSAHAYYFVVFEADFITSGIKYEGRDEVAPLFLHKKSSPGAIPNPLPILFPLEYELFLPSPDFSGPIPLITPPSFVLRR